MPRTRKPSPAPVEENKAAEAQAAQNQAQQAVATAESADGAKKEPREIAYINNIPKSYVQNQEGKGARVGVTMPMEQEKMNQQLVQQADLLAKAKANPELGIRVPVVSQPVTTVYINSRDQQIIQNQYNTNAVNLRAYEMPVKAPGKEREVVQVDGIKALNDGHKEAISQYRQHLAEPNGAAIAYNKENAKNIEAAQQRAETIAKAQEQADKVAAAPEAGKEVQAEA